MPPPQQPPKKKSYWWVALIVVAGVAILAGVVAYAIIVSRPTTVRSTFLTNDPAGDSVRLRAPPVEPVQRPTSDVGTVLKFSF
jgi:flagellar basal body-associated protein FliL